MKKWYLILFVLILSICFCGCSNNEASQYQENVFTRDMFEGVESVTFYDFNETKYTSYDEDIINELVNMLVTAKLEKLDEDEYVEGAYMFSLNKKDGMIDIGLGNVIGYDYNQYRSNITSSQINDLVNGVKETAALN